MTRIEIFKQEIAFILTLISANSDSISYNSTEGHTITMIIESDIKPCMIEAISQRYGNDYLIKSTSGLRTQIVVDISDKLKNAEPEKKHVILRTFDKILVRDGEERDQWNPDFLERMYDKPDSDGDICRTITGFCWSQVIPYNDDTAHLIGTTDMPDVEYEIEFKK